MAMAMAMAMVMASKTNLWLCFLLVVTLSSLFISSSSTFQSDELIVDDEEFGLEGQTATVSPDLDYVNPSIQSPQSTIKKRSSSSHHDSADSKVQFSLDHAFGLAHSHFSPAGTFTARLKTWNHGGQTLTKMRFSREDFTDSDKEKFERLLKDDDFYRIRLPSNVLSPPGKDYILSAVRARCIAGDSLDEHFVIHMEGVNIVGVNYGSPGACQYPRPLRLPKKWSFNSYTVLKSSEQAPRAPAFTEDIIGGENGEEGVVPPPERSFWAKYWMYLIPLGLIVMNAGTQAMNLPEETAAGQSASQPQQTTVQRAPPSAVRRR